MEKILVTGGSGLLGSRLVRLAEYHFEVIPTHHAHAVHEDSVKMDITRSDEVFQVVAKVKPHSVIHVAAETNVDHCEKNKEEAWKVNFEGTKNIALACAKVHAKLVYVSTDYVFDGTKGFYIEIDKPNPVNYYGWTKRKAEEFVEDNCSDFVIARTSVLYGWHSLKSNFALWVIESLKRRKPIAVVDDHFNSPTLADNLAEALLEIVEKNLNGIFHTAGSERINRYEFALKIAENFSLDPSLIAPIKMSDLKAWIAKRPCDSSLCVNKVQKQIKTKFLTVREGLKVMKTNCGENSISFKN